MVTKKKSTAKRKVIMKSQSHKSITIKPGVYQTFRVTPDLPTFFQPRVTRQTFYWAFLLLFIIVMQLIIIAENLNANIVLDNLR